MANRAFDAQDRGSISPKAFPLEEVAAAKLYISGRATREPVEDWNPGLPYTPVCQPKRGFGSTHRSTPDASFPYTGSNQSEGQGVGAIPGPRNSLLTNALLWARRFARMTRRRVRIFRSSALMDAASVVTFGDRHLIRRLYLRPVRGS